MSALYLSFFINFSPLQFIPFVHSFIRMAHFLHQKLKNLSPNLKLSTFWVYVFLSTTFRSAYHKNIPPSARNVLLQRQILYCSSTALAYDLRCRFDFLLCKVFWLCYNSDISTTWSSSFLLHQMIHYLITSKQREGWNIRAVQRPIRTSVCKRANSKLSIGSVHLTFAIECARRFTPTTQINSALHIFILTSQTSPPHVLLLSFTSVIPVFHNTFSHYKDCQFRFHCIREAPSRIFYSNICRSISLGVCVLKMNKRRDAEEGTS